MFSDDEDGYFSSDDESGVIVNSSNDGKSESKDNNNGRVKGKRHLDEMKDLFGLKELKTKTVMRREKRKRRKERQKHEKKEGIISTLATQSSSHPPPEIHVFVDPQKKHKRKDSVQMEEEEGSRLPKSEENQRTTTMKEARFDVFKFGLSGFDKVKKDDAEEALAIRLGAKPRKNKCLPYEEFKKIRKAEKEELREKQLLKNSFAKKKPSKQPSDKKQTRSEKINTKVGKFDGGMLKISAAELKKMKGS
ncbi:uncharacterized protein [Lepeophtheirus salmonis]|nr:uncharacterized protein C1orf131 homolog [Lepeophtheirus salmonis]